MSFRARRFPVSIAAALLAGAAACAPLATSSSWDPLDSQITVENRGWDDMTLFLVRGGMEIRIGRVSGFASEVITVPAALAGGAGNVRIRGRSRIRDIEFTSHSFDLVRGADVRLVVEPNAGLSHVEVR